MVRKIHKFTDEDLKNDKNKQWVKVGSKALQKKNVESQLCAYDKTPARQTDKKFAQTNHTTDRVLPARRCVPA